MKKIAFIILSSVVTGAFAQTDDQISRVTRLLEGTIYVVPHRESVGGVLSACGLEFSGLSRDFSTKKGAPVKIVGSFYFRPHPKVGIAYMLKLGVFDGLTMKNATAPHHAFVRAPSGNAPKNSVKRKSDTDGFALFVGAFDDDVLAAYESIVSSSQLVVGFNRKPAQQDVTMKVDLTVVDTKIGSDGQAMRQHSNVPVDEFFECSSALLKNAQAATN